MTCRLYQIAIRGGVIALSIFDLITLNAV